ncbi:MAG: MFS transporter [Candidatus Entotheonellia bacterium]
MPAKGPSGVLLIGLAYLGFVSIGLPDGLLGVAWPSIRAHFDLPIDALGALLVMFTLGYLLSSFSSGRLLTHINVGSLLTLSCLATAVSLLGYALAPQWWMMVVLGLLAGLGAGAIDAGLNTYAATHFSPRSVNWLHACYGVGATIGPLIMTSVLMADRSWQWGYGMVGMWQLLLAACFGLTHQWWPPASASKGVPASAPVRAASSSSTLRLPVVWLSMAVFSIYTGLEAAAGVWPYSLFTEARAIPASTAGMWVGVYWGGLTAGRLLSGLAVGFMPVRLLLRFCIVGIALGATLVWLHLADLLSFLGLALMGLSSAPVFPTLIATTPARLGDAHTANGVGFQIAAAVLGQSLLPAVLGVLARNLGLEIIGPSLLTAAILLLALYEVLMTTSGKHLRRVESTVTAPGLRPPLIAQSPRDRELP